VINLVLPAKIFEISNEIEFGFLIQKLKNFQEEEQFKTESGNSFNLVTEVLDLQIEENKIFGVFSKDYIKTQFYKREIVESPITEEAPFWILPSNDRNFMIVFAPSVSRGVKKLLTCNVANKLSKVLFIQTGIIVESTIPHSNLKDLHESNPQATRLIWFDQVDIPGVEKLCLAGMDIANTDLYHTYMKHGKIWYVVYKSQKNDLVIGITRNAVVTLFSKITINDFVIFIQKNILDLLEKK
jgi:hypothetical protein